MCLPASKGPCNAPDLPRRRRDLLEVRAPVTRWHVPQATLGLPAALAVLVGQAEDEHRGQKGISAARQ